MTYNDIIKNMMHKVRKVYTAVLCAILCIALGGCAPQKNSAVGFYLNTVITVTGYCAEDVLESALLLCGEYEKLLSRTEDGSDVWRINHANGAPVTVDGRTAEVIEAALDISEKSGGAFDITVAPVMELWNFTSSAPVLPRSESVMQAVQLVDYTKLKLDANTVTLPAGMMIDLGAIAKGYIADKTAEYLRACGVESAVLNFGGNTVALGAKPSGHPWRIGIQNPYAPTGESLALVEVADASVVTSGVYERGFDVDGVRYHHILDSATGWPVQNGLAAVTIVAANSTLADALSTACFALGAEEGGRLAQSLNAEALFITDEGEMISTDGMKTMLDMGN